MLRFLPLENKLVVVVISKILPHLRLILHYIVKENTFVINQSLHLQASQNKCIRFCLQLDKRSKIRVKEFLQLNWLTVHDTYLQFTVSDIFTFPNDQSVLLV